MNAFQKILYFFSQYTDPIERKIGKFFASLNEDNSRNKISQQLLQLMQSDLVKINLLSEKKYKGYKYLTKTKRRKLYVNAEFIIADFTKFYESNQFNIKDILAEIRNSKSGTDGLAEYHDKLIYLRAIMEYFSPKRGVYFFRESSTFGELLKDPTTEKLLGDCNQIVTLYVYLYSKKYDINDLQLKTYPGHVAIHFKGVDIEATNGEFHHYEREGQRILPIQEIVSINLLDVTDQYYKTHSISPESQLQSARLAILVSSEQKIAVNNLEIAYHNIVANLMKQNSFNLALKYAKQSKDHTLLQLVGHNGAIFSLKNKQYKNAEKFAQYANKKAELLNEIRHSQAIDSYNDGEYNKAISQLKRLGGYQDLIKKCYVGLFMNEQKKLGELETIDDVKSHKSTINNMYYFAKKSENGELIEYAKSLLKYIR